MSPRAAPTRYAAFLRAINVAGHGLIKMSDLREAFAASGATNVKTFIQSGNVVFDAPADDVSRISTRVHARLHPLLGVAPIVMYREISALERILANDPFKGVRHDPSVKLYTTFLLEKPTPMPKVPIVWEKEGVEVVAMKGLDLFVVSRPLKGGRYGFPNLPAERALRVMATSRNWNTLEKVVHLARD